MKLSLFGYKLDVKYIIAAIVLYFIISSLTITSCSKINSLQEGMAVLGHSMGEGVSTSWENKEQEQPIHGFRGKEHDANQAELVQPDQELSFFSKTEFKPECCGSNYASSGGCACMNKQQMDFINTRGGNRTTDGI